MITKEEIKAVQKRWARAVIRIGKLKSNKSGSLIAAKYLLSELYAYDLGEVLFKPTKATYAPFRMNEEGALSYFIGGNPKFPEDTGFALNPWEKIIYRNAAIQTADNIAMAMGHYIFIDPFGDETVAEYSLGYIKNEQGQIKINLHHSSLPYSTSNVQSEIERRSTKMDILHGTTDYRIRYT